MVFEQEDSGKISRELAKSSSPVSPPELPDDLSRYRFLEVAFPLDESPFFFPILASVLVEDTSKVLPTSAFPRSIVSMFFSVDR